MFTHKEITDRIFWVGALDYDIKVFDIIMKTEFGTTYNSYLVKGDSKTALFETVKEQFFDEFLERLSNISSVGDIDYVIVNHTEPDHVGSVAKLLDLNPDITVIGSNIAIKYLNAIVNKPYKSLVAKHDDTLDLGGKTVQFISVPNLHWPDSMYSYLKEDEILITCDSFGCHYCSDLVFNDLIDADFYEAYQYYYDAIMSPFKPFVLKALEKIENCSLKVVCPGHGPVLRTDIQKYIDYYRIWSAPTKLEKVVIIPYVSAYGYTKKLAVRISEGIREEGYEAELYDLVEDDAHLVIKRMHNAVGILFGSPTILSDALPPIFNLLTELNPIIHKGKFACAFGSYGWSGEAVPNIIERLKQLKFKVPFEGLKVNFNPSDEQLNEAFEFGRKFAEAIISSEN